MTDDLCGSTNTSSGVPCKWNIAKKGECPFHNTDDPPENGRPTKLSYERQERIATAVEEGVPLVAACRLNNISHETHTNWMEKGQEEDEGPYADYFGRLTRALGTDQEKKTQQLWEAAQETNDTATMLTVLKQRYPETWQDQDIGEAQPGVRQSIPEDLVKEWYEQSP